MLEVVQFAVLGLGTGAIYALVGQGVVLIYRASGILNFAQGALAMVGAYTFFESTNAGLPKPVALLVVVAALAILGSAIYWLLMKPLRQASPLVRVIATLGVLLVLQAIASLRYGAVTVFVDSWLPTSSLQWGQLLVPQDRLWLTGFAVVLTGVLYTVSKATKFGLATTAVSENERATASVGWSPDLLSAVNWAIGAALAGVAGILITPLTSLSGTSLTWIVVPAMAAALIGGFSSFELTLVAGLAIGILQSEITRYYPQQGFAQSVPLLLIVLVLVIRGQSLPLRSHLIERLPALGSGVIRVRYAAPLAVIALVIIMVFPFNWVVALSSSLAAGMILLSIVVLTGYAGQLSLAQYSIAGIGALVASKLVIAGWPFGFAIVAAIGGAVLAGLVFAIPALRARGVNLAIVTVALGLSLQYTVFTNVSIAGGTDGLRVGSQHLFGIDLDTLASPREYAVLCLVSLGLVMCIVGNVRRSRTGRRLIAVRTNERAAASLGINVLGAKLYAFGLSAAIAGLGGTLLAFMNPAVYFSIFDPVRSITAVLLSVVGGVGYIIGALFGATLADGGFPGGVIVQNFGGQEWLTLIGGVAVLLILLQDPNGMARSSSVAVKHLLAQIARRIGLSGSAAKRRHYWNEEALDAHQRAEESTLEIQNLSVRFGGVIALNDVSFTLRTGEVLGLIGPNGAGKTTLIDAVTGFVKPSGGEVILGGKSVTAWRPHRRSRAGLSRSFQSLELFDDISVLDNIRAAEDKHDGLAYLTNLFYRGESPLTAAAVAAIKAFGLEEDLEKRADELSFGRRRLVSIARAASTAPVFLLLDEPCAGLSETETRETGLLIRELANQWGVGIILIEHDVAMVMSTCDRVVVIDFGNKIAEGSPDAVRADEAVKEAYLGGSRIQVGQGA